MAGKRASLAEMMGSKAAGATELRLSQLKDILGEAMPELPRNPVGRHRLVRSLQQRFGSNFRSLPGLKNLIQEFDEDVEFEKKVAKMKSIKYQPSKRK